MVLCACVTFAQDQLENPGFEHWEDILVSANDTIREPLEWSSLKTSDDPTLSAMAPVVCKRSSDAHSGEYSVQLTNVLSFIVANGVVASGIVHPNLVPQLANIHTDTLDDRWNMPLTTRPDSIVGWFKYTPQGKDTLQVKAVLHRGYAQQPDAAYETNWTGVAEFLSPLNTEGDWVRFAAPFEYFSDETPEYILVVLNSGNAYAPVAGSVALFDDLELVYNAEPTSLERTREREVTIYATGYHQLMIRGMEDEDLRSARIYEITGKLVWEGPVTSGQADISSAGLRRGIYVVTLTGKQRVYSQKIMLL